MTERSLHIWTIYERPLDFPDSYVARRFEVSRGVTVATKQIMLARDIAPIRATLAAKGLVKIARSPADDPNIVETWI